MGCFRCKNRFYSGETTRFPTRSQMSHFFQIFVFSIMSGWCAYFQNQQSSFLSTKHALFFEVLATLVFMNLAWNCFQVVNTSTRGGTLDLICKTKQNASQTLTSSLIKLTTQKNVHQKCPLTPLNLHLVSTTFDASKNDTFSIFTHVSNIWIHIFKSIQITKDIESLVHFMLFIASFV